MEILYVLVPLSVVLIGLAIAIFFWAINSEQFDDLDTPAWRILDDDERIKQRSPAAGVKQK